MRYILASILAAVILYSCNDWLTVMPDSVIESDKLLQTDQGVQNALNGVYNMLSHNIYHPSGRLGGTGLPERMAGSYNYGFDNVELGFDNIYPAAEESSNTYLFQGVYVAIANVNELINGSEEHEPKLTPEIYYMVRGEALAIRALLHFDLMRVYGPVPVNANPSEAYLPYVKVNTYKGTPYTPYEEYMAMVLEDLNEAEEILEQYDPIITEPWEVTEIDGYVWQHRRCHMNYYGVLGLQARIRQYFGMITGEDGALAYARRVIEAKEPGGALKFRLTTAEDFTGGEYSDDRTYWTEHLSCIKCEWFDTFDRSDYSEPFQTWNVDQSTPMGIENGYNRDHFSNFRNDFLQFMTSGEGAATTDIRWANNMIRDKYRSMAAGGYMYVCGKWTHFTAMGGIKTPRNFPLVRLAEIYMMVMEHGTLAEANQLYEEYCAARSAEYIPLTEADRSEGGRLLWEFIREFYSEGQNFFRYKRTGERFKALADTECSHDSYRLPIPLREQSNIQ